MVSDYIALAHCRVSRGTKEEIENSLKSQQREIIILAQKLDIPLDKIDWFIEDEARSSFSERADWEEFDKKIEETCNNINIEYFLAYSQERFCRNSRRSKMYKEKLRSHGIKVRFVTGDVENPETIEGFIMDHTNEMIAQMYSMKVSKDTLRGCIQNAVTRDPETGYVYKNGGQPPFWLQSKEIVIGKNTQGKNLVKTIWVENSKIHTAILNGKPVTKTMWDWAKYYFLDLRLKQELSIKHSRDILNELKIPAPRKDKWENTGLYEAEKNVALYGLSIYNKRQFSGTAKGRLKDVSEWIQEENAYPALLTKEQFEQLALLRNSMNRKKGLKNNVSSRNDKLFVNDEERYFCKNCGHKLISSGDFYLCGKYNSQGKSGCGASHFAVPAQWLEEKVINDIKSFFTDKILQQTYNDFIAELKKQSKPDTTKISEIEKNIKHVEKDINSLVKTLTELAKSGNQIAAHAVGNEVQKLAKQKESMEAELNESKKAKLTRLPNFNEFKKQSMITKALLSPKNIAEKRKIISMFVKSVMLDPIERTAIVEYYKNPLCVLLKNDTKSAITSPNKKGSPLKTSIALVAGAGFEPTTSGL